MRSLVVMPQIWRKNRLMASSIIWAFIISLELVEHEGLSEILTGGLVSMGRLHGLRLGMSHQNDAAQKVAAASADLGGRRERKLAREPGIKRAGEAAGQRPPRALKLQRSDRAGPNRFRRHPEALQCKVCHAGGRPRWSCGCGRGKSPAEQ